jgi:hypothetical protein
MWASENLDRNSGEGEDGEGQDGGMEGQRVGQEQPVRMRRKGEHGSGGWGWGSNKPVLLELPEGR